MPRLCLGVTLYEDIVCEKDGKELIRIAGSTNTESYTQNRNRICIEAPKDIRIYRVPAKERS